MRPIRRLSAAAFFIAVILAPALASADVTMISATRTGGAPLSHDFGQYIGHSVSANSQVDHVSNITSNGVTFDMEAYSAAGSQGAQLTFTFYLDVDTPFWLFGTYENAGPGTPSQGIGTWSLTGPGVHLTCPGGYYQTLPFSFSGTLVSGDYTFTASSNAISNVMQSHYWPVGSSLQGNLILGVPAPSASAAVALGVAAALRRRQRCA